MLKEKREKEARTPSSSPHDSSNIVTSSPTTTTPSTAAGSSSSMAIKEENPDSKRGDSDHHGENDGGSNISPKRETSPTATPSRPGTGSNSDKKSESSKMLKQEDSSDDQTTLPGGLDSSSQVVPSSATTQSNILPNSDTTNSHQQQTTDAETTFACSVQPLASNLMAKQSGGGGGGLEYMQQSSQIFVFSTTLANKGAESVLNGHYPSIIAYHCDLAETKKILEKHPLKLGQFNRHAPWNMMNTFGGQHKFPPSGPPPPPCGGRGGNSNNNKGQRGTGTPMLNTPDSLDGEPNDPVWSEALKNAEMGNENGSAAATMNSVAAAMAAANASFIQGVKVPDENLTPQQRQHREEQLAHLRKMQIMLFPEQSDTDGDVGPMLQDDKMGDGGDMNGRLMDFLQCPPTHHPPMSMAAPTPGGPSFGGPKGHPDWSRLPPHHSFDHEQHQQQQQQQQRKNPRGTGGQQRTHGPPPPYHQTPRSASVPIATHSPSPNSPQNHNSTLSLPSPRAAASSSALPSPSDSSRHVTPLRHLSPASAPNVASPSTTLARPLTHSSPATPSSAHLSPCPLPSDDSKLPSSPASRTPSHSTDALKSETVASPSVTCSPVPVSAGVGHDSKGVFFPDMSGDSAQEHMRSGFGLPDNNIPLNPENANNPETTKVMSFDPISSLAQMSQQLTNNTPPFNGGAGPNGNMMGGQMNPCSYPGDMTMGGAPPHMQRGGPGDGPEEGMMDCVQMHNMVVTPSDIHTGSPYGKMIPSTVGKPLSPKMVPGPGIHGGAPSVNFSGGGGPMPRMPGPAGRLCPPVSHPDSYNGANVQVRASAPNTIQYLPARPQLCPQMPRPPPSLDFLQRFANPPHNGNDCGGGRGDVMLPQDLPMRGVRLRHDPHHHGPPPGGPPMMNGVFQPMHDGGAGGMFQGGPPPQMRHMGGGGGGPPFGGGGPTPDKMLEPSTSTPPFVGPSTSDPNYAQQFHNFQQQLYATTTRSIGSSVQGGGPGQTYFISK